MKDVREIVEDTDRTLAAILISVIISGFGLIAFIFGDSHAESSINARATEWASKQENKTYLQYCLRDAVSDTRVIAKCTFITGDRELVVLFDKDFNRLP